MYTFTILGHVLSGTREKRRGTVDEKSRIRNFTTVTATSSSRGSVGRHLYIPLVLYLEATNFSDSKPLTNNSRNGSTVNDSVVELYLVNVS